MLIGLCLPSDLYRRETLALLFNSEMSCINGVHGHRRWNGHRRMNRLRWIHLSSHLRMIRCHNPNCGRHWCCTDGCMCRCWCWGCIRCSTDGSLRYHCWCQPTDGRLCRPRGDCWFRRDGYRSCWLRPDGHLRSDGRLCRRCPTDIGWWPHCRDDVRPGGAGYKVGYPM